MFIGRFGDPLSSHFRKSTCLPIADCFTTLTIIFCAGRGCVSCTVTFLPTSSKRSLQRFDLFSFFSDPPRNSLYLLQPLLSLTPSDSTFPRPKPRFLHFASKLPDCLSLRSLHTLPRWMTICPVSPLKLPPGLSKRSPSFAGFVAIPSFFPSASSPSFGLFWWAWVGVVF